MPDYDVVVIGAGNGGLTCALTLAQAGRRVLMLERHNVPGGCATSFVRGRFEFEVALHQLSGMGSPERPGPLRAILGEMGVLDKLEFVQDLVVGAGASDTTAPSSGRLHCLIGAQRFSRPGPAGSAASQRAARCSAGAGLRAAPG